AYASSFANNGQAFNSMAVNSPFWNATTLVAMLAGRLGLAVLALALASDLASQPVRPMSRGTLPTASLTFGAAMVGTVVIVVSLEYCPALALGPIVEQLKLLAAA